MWGLGHDTLLGIFVGLNFTWSRLVVGLCASGNTLLGIAFGFMWDLGQQTLLGIVVGYVAPRATHFTDYCCWLTRGLGQHTLLDIAVAYARFLATHFTGHHRSDMWGASINGFKIIPFLRNSRKVEVSVSYLLRNC
jgi:hypothetical protein